jgi:5-histidylcysteine sulfoxide synthase
MPISISRNPNLAFVKRQFNTDNQVQKNFKEVYKTNWWTGLDPEHCPGFDRERNCLVSLPHINLSICTKQDVLDAFNNVWTLTELLFSGIKTEETYVRPPYHGLRHPMMFYYGHTSVVYFNKMRLAGIIKEPINLYLEKILETGVDEMSWDDMSKNEMAWPKLIEVHAYRKTIYNLVIKFINENKELDLPASQRNLMEENPIWSLWMGIAHEHIHLETSSVLIRELPIELVERPKFFAPIHPSHLDNSPMKNAWNVGTKKSVVVGKPKNEPSYGWDNEYGNRTVEIENFHYSKYQISNREFFEFVATGAYVEDKYWNAEGLHWRKYRNTKRPTFWAGVGPEGSHEYCLRTIFEFIPMPWNFPVEVNYHEAMAYCLWKKEKDKTNMNYRLMTEPEFTSIAKKKSDAVLQIKEFLKYQKMDETFSSNFNLLWSTPRTVDEELYGNVWHWMMDQFNPLNEFKVHYLYDDFSTPCFDGKHQMILGGSFISCGNEASQWSRFHFRPHFYQHSGFRIAYTDNGSLDNGATKISNQKEYVHPRRLNVLDQLNKKDWWKEINQPLEMTEEEVKKILNVTNTSIIKFNREFNKMSPMGSSHDPQTNKLKANFSLPYIQTKNFPTNPTSYDENVKIVFEDLVPTSMLPGHPGFAAYVAGATNTISNTAQMIAQTINPYTGHYMMAPGLVTLEEEAIQWFINLFGLNEKTSNGFFTSGSSMAALSAIMMARQNKIKGHDLSKVTGYISREGHHSLTKNWVMLGFKKENLRLVHSKNFKMDLTQLNKLLQEDKKNNLIPFLVISTAGTTKTGSIDPIEEIGEIALENNLWHHVDGAYGAPFMLTQQGRQKLHGISLCDSLTLDLHKAFSLPYGTGMLLVKNAENMIFNYSSDDSYMPPRPDEHFDFADISPELSRDYRGLRVWLPIKTLGIDPFILNLEEKLELAKYANEKLKTFKNIEVINDPELTIQTFKHRNGNQATKDLLTKINNDQTLFLSSATVNGEEVIRLCLLGYKLHFEKLEKGLAVIEKLSGEI